MEASERKFIPGTGHAYSCDRDGNIYSHYKKGSNLLSEEPTRKLVPHHGATSLYLQVGLSLDGVCKNYLIHRLVAQTWVSNPNNYPEIDHIDNDITNNKVENLQWVTRQMNIDKQEVDRGALNGLRSYCELFKDGGEFICAFPSITAACVYASENFGCSKSGMAKYHKSKGYYLIAENEEKKAKMSQKIKSKWELFDPENNSLGFFSSKREAARFIKNNIRDISIKRFSDFGKAYGYYVIEKSVETN